MRKDIGASHSSLAEHTSILRPQIESGALPSSALLEDALRLLNSKAADIKTTLPGASEAVDAALSSLQSDSLKQSLARSGAKPEFAKRALQDFLSTLQLTAGELDDAVSASSISSTVEALTGGAAMHFRHPNLAF
jgi:hypothetical protein